MKEFHCHKYGKVTVCPRYEPVMIPLMPDYDGERLNIKRNSTDDQRHDAKNQADTGSPFPPVISRRSWDHSHNLPINYAERARKRKEALESVLQDPICLYCKRLPCD